jgi:hypothetical protein
MTSTQFEKRLNILQYVIVALLIAVVVVPIALGWWVSRQLPVVNAVEIENMQIAGEPSFCPGEPLVITYDFHAKGAGVLVRDFTLWNIEPPRTLIYSTSRRFILDGPIDQHLRETWHVPVHYLNYETEDTEPIPPGRYRRYMAISSPSRSSVIDIEHVDFEIKDCP